MFLKWETGYDFARRTTACIFPWPAVALLLEDLSQSEN